MYMHVCRNMHGHQQHITQKSMTQLDVMYYSIGMYMSMYIQEFQPLDVHIMKG